MKNIILIFTIAFFTTYANAQQGQGRGRGGNRQGQQQGQGQNKLQEFKAENAVGIIVYDADEIIKKTKIKDKNTKYLITKAVNSFNQQLVEIKFINAEKLEKVTTLVNLKRKEAMANRNMEEMKSIQSSAKELLKPIKQQVKAEEKILNNQFKELLNEKQFKKWKKYQKAKKRALKPKGMSQGNKQQKGNGQHKGQGGGMGRGRH